MCRKNLPVALSREPAVHVFSPVHSHPAGDHGTGKAQLTSSRALFGRLSHSHKSVPLHFTFLVHRVIIYCTLRQSGTCIIDMVCVGSHCIIMANIWDFWGCFLATASMTFSLAFKGIIWHVHKPRSQRLGDQIDTSLMCVCPRWHHQHWWVGCTI